MLLVEWSDLKIGNQVAKSGGDGGGGECGGGFGAVWEASVDDMAISDRIAASNPTAVDGALRSTILSPRSCAATSPPTAWPPPTALPPPTRLPPILPVSGRYSRTLRGHANGLTARIISEEVVSLHSHEALFEMSLALFALSPPERVHPYVLPTLGLATDGASKYALLMPRCQINLEGLLQMAEETLSLRFRLVTVWKNLACAIADGLTFLHRQGIAHAALHPGNVLLDEQMRPRLADYGPSMCRLRATYARVIASNPAVRSPERRSPERRRASSAAASATSGVITARSNLLYLSPESLALVGTAQVWSAGRALDLGSDIWALGCLVVRLAMLKPLYYKECADREWCDYISWTPEAYMHPAMLAAFARVRMCISSGAWRPAAQLVGEAFLPMGLLELVEQCTSLMPAERPSSAKVHLGLVRLFEEASELSSDSSLRRDDLWLRRRKRYDYDVSMRPLRDAYRAVALTTPAPVPFSELERRRHSMVALRAVAAREAAGQARQISAVDIQRISGEDPDGQIYSA
jgi:serine/threonine protein kinase